MKISGKISSIKVGDLIVFDKFHSCGPTGLNERENVLVLHIVEDNLWCLTVSGKFMRFFVYNKDKFRIIAKFVNAEF